MVRNEFPNKNKHRKYPVKQGSYNEGSLSYRHMRNVALILLITAIMAALTSLSAHVTDKLLRMGNSQVIITAFSLRDQLKEVVAFDSTMSGGNNNRHVN
jgi:hypothetical protein